MELKQFLDQNYFLITLSLGSIYIYLFTKRPNLVKKNRYN